MAIIAVAGLNVKLAMRSQDWSFLSLMNIESLGFNNAPEKDSKDSIKDSLSIKRIGPKYEYDVVCKSKTTTTTTTTTATGTTTSKTENPKTWNVNASGTGSSLVTPVTTLGGTLGGGYSSGGTTTTTTTPNTTNTTTNTTTEKTSELTLKGVACLLQDSSACTKYEPKCPE
jgi:hypothetical protein